jgi:hypothetical protein
MEQLSTWSLGVALVALVVGMMPCLGWVGWLGTPIAGIALLSGLLGLIVDRDADGRARNVALHAAALIVGLLGGGLGAIRCGLGGGCL